MEMTTEKKTEFVQVGRVTVNVAAISRIEWDFAGHKDTAMVTFTGGDFYWVQDAAQTEKLRHVTVFGGTE